MYVCRQDRATGCAGEDGGRTINESTLPICPPKGQRLEQKLLASYKADRQWELIPALHFHATDCCYGVNNENWRRVL